MPISGSFVLSSKAFCPEEIVPKPCPLPMVVSLFGGSVLAPSNLPESQVTEEIKSDVSTVAATTALNATEEKEEERKTPALSSTVVPTAVSSTSVPTPITDEKKVTIIGVGRLGLCFALVLASKGYNVVGVDLSPTYVDHINNKTLRSSEPGVEEYLRIVTTMRATTSLVEGAHHSDLLFVLVDTPSTGGERHYDHSKLSSVLSNLNTLQVRNKHIVIGCTVMPGYIANVGRFLVKDCENCSLSYNPEFIAQGDIINGQLRPDMILIGQGSSQAGIRLRQLYRNICDGWVPGQKTSPLIKNGGPGKTDSGAYLRCMTPESAEICKLALNCFVTMKVAFANLVGDIAEATFNARASDITAAMGCDTRIGNKYLQHGYGFGGPCFPRDNRALRGYANSIGVEAALFLATDEDNKEHTKTQLQRLMAETDPSQTYVFTGVAYKLNTRVPIIEESQRLALAVGLARDGRKVIIRDYADTLHLVRMEYGALFHGYVVLADGVNFPEPLTSYLPRSS